MNRITFFLFFMAGILWNTFGQPIPISSIEELQKIGTESNYPISGNYFLTKDIDASEISANEGFTPIGNSLNVFTGSLDGQGHTIKGLTINRPFTDDVGLFGAISGTIKNLTLLDVSITGAGNCGGLVGWNKGGTISNCSITGNVYSNYSLAGGMVGNNEGTVSYCSAVVEVNAGEFVGGLVGYNNGTISNTYSRGIVTGVGDVGGLVGTNEEGFIVNSYSTGLVIGQQYTGGLIGWNNGTVSGSYWDINTSGQNESDGGEGRTTGDMTYPYSSNTFVNWDFVETWGEDGGYNYNNGYPFLRELAQYDAEIISCNLPSGLPVHQPFTMTLQFRNTGIKKWSATEGVLLGAVGNYDNLAPPENWRSSPDFDVFPGGIYNYTIELNPQQEGTFVTEWQMLKEGEFWFGEIFSQEVEVGGPIGISSVEELQLIGNDPDYPLHWSYYLAKDIDASGTESWNEDKGFEPLRTFSGTFDGKGHVIKGLVIDREEEDYVGLFGLLSGEVKNLSVTRSSISGKRYTGGLAGYNEGTIANSSGSGAVLGDNSIGGLIGWNTGSISNSYSRGSVTGRREVGGLTGVNEEGTIWNSYASALVTGEEYVGGLVGNNYWGDISGSYWDVDTSKQEQSDGGKSRSQEDMTYPYATDTFTGWDFDRIWGADRDYRRNNGYPYLRKIAPYRTFAGWWSLFE